MLKVITSRVYESSRKVLNLLLKLNWDSAILTLASLNFTLLLSNKPEPELKVEGEALWVCGCESVSQMTITVGSHH